MASTTNDKRSGFYSRRFEWSMLRPRYWKQWLWVGFAGLLFLLPRRLRDRLGGALAALIYRYGHKRRNVALTNLRLCFPDIGEDEREALARASFRVATQVVLDYGALTFLSNGALMKLVEIEGLERIEKSRAAGRSVLVLAPHFIALDFGGIALSGRLPTVSMFKSMKDPVSDWLIYRARSRFGAPLVERDMGLRPVIRPVREGMLFYYLPDEDLGPEHSVFAPFFGVPAATLPSLGRLAKMCDADVFPCLTSYSEERGRYCLHIEPAMRDFPAGDPVEDATRMNQAVEQLVGLGPEQYMWSLKRFRTRPPGEERLY